MNVSSRRLRPLFACAALCGAAALSASDGPSARATARVASSTDTTLGTVPPAGDASASVSSCHPSTVQADRYVTFAAAMTATRRTKQMWIRFTLLERLPTDLAMHAVAAPGLGVWEKSTPGITLFRSSQVVANLVAPGSFRAEVSFRWYDGHHRAIVRTRRPTSICAMPDERPHLAVGAITRSPGAQPQTTSYAVSVSNEGLGPASNVGVLLSVNGAAQPQQTISELAPAATQTVTFDAPRCSAPGSLTVTLDPARSVDQTTRADDVKTVPCP